jgi:hypothetical protein
VAEDDDAFLRQAGADGVDGTKLRRQTREPANLALGQGDARIGTAWPIAAAETDAGSPS